MSLFVTRHAIERAEERFPALGTKSHEEIIKLINLGANRGTLISEFRRWDRAKRKYRPAKTMMIDLAEEQAVVVVSGNTIITVLGLDEYINLARESIGEMLNDLPAD